MTRIVLIALILAFAVTACGRKGDLKPPPGAEPPDRTEDVS